MRICIVGKYPPIEGGVSAQTYWAARGLAERGHEVFVVTNATEVEERYRIRLDPGDRSFLEPAFSNGGAVRVFEPEHQSYRMTHIPMSNPFVSKLAGVAVQVVQGFGCDVIVGSYFEPYGLAAWLAATWTGTRLLLDHAGSDLDRLMRLPELAVVYKQILRSAAGVITRPALARRFIGMGIRTDALLAGAPNAISGMFSPVAPPLDPADVERLAFSSPEGRLPGRTLDPRVPTIGMYGKPGVTKGTYDFIAALGLLRDAGLDFNLMLLCGVGQRDQLRAAVTAARLSDRAWLLPFLPNWRVPSFIRACTAVCFLERDFPVTIHGPVVAQEVLACGSCLILSGEIHDKQRNHEELVDGHNFILAPDPKDRESLAKRLRAVIEQPDQAAEIGARGRLVAAGLPSYEDFADAWEDIVSGRGRNGLGMSSGPVADRLADTLPWARPLLGDSLDDLAAEFAADPAWMSAADDIADPVLAERFCDYASGRFEGHVGEVIRYALARLWAARDDDMQPSAPSAQNALAGQQPSMAAMRVLFPYRSVVIRIERFDHDVTPALCRMSSPGAADPVDFARRLTVIGFARMPNLSSTELRLNDITVALIERCAGNTRADAIAESMAAWVNGRGGIVIAADQVFIILARLYASGVIGFAESATAGAALF